MNVDCHVDDDRRVVTLTLTGKLTDDGLLGLAPLLQNTPALHRGYGLIYDLRFSDGFAVTAAGVRKMAAAPAVIPLTSRRAIVVPMGLGYGMARMYQLLRGDKAPHVFTDLDAAQLWMDTGITP